MNLKRMLTRVVMAAVVATAGLSTTALAQDDFYAGKTVTIVTNASPGGSTDLQARLFADFWSKHTPGNPTFIIQPMPGGAQLKGINFVLNTAKPDGLTVSWVAWGGATRALDPPERQVPFDTFEFIGGSGIPLISYIRKDVPPGLGAPADIVKAEEVTLGGFRPSSSFDLIGRLALDMLGVPYDYVAGFRGGGPTNAALLRNEIQMQVTAANSYLSIFRQNAVETGEAIGLWYYAVPDADGTLQLSDAFPDMTSFHELYESVKGAPPSGIEWDVMNWLVSTSAGMTWLTGAPPGTPDDLVAQLREGYHKARVDPEYLAAALEQSKIEPVFQSVEDGQAIIASLGEVDPEIVSFLRDYIKAAEN